MEVGDGETDRSVYWISYSGQEDCLCGFQVATVKDSAFIVVHDMNSIFFEELSSENKSYSHQVNV